MSKAEKEQEPLLYVYKPKTEMPIVNVQKTYLIKNEENAQAIDESSLNSEPFERTKKQVSTPGNSHLNTKDTSSSDNYPISEEKSQGSSLKKVKRFKEMTIDEKLEYLANFPRVLPPVPCLYTTNEGSYSGTLLNYSEEEVEIRLLNGKSVPLKTASILEIKMLVLQ